MGRDDAEHLVGDAIFQINDVIADRAVALVEVARDIDAVGTDGLGLNHYSANVGP